MNKNFGVKFLVLFLCFSVTGAIADNNVVEEVYYWKDVIYEDLPYDDNFYIGPYPLNIPSNNDVLAVEYHAASGLMLVNVARVRPGVPSTLNAFCATDYAKGTSPHLWAFPDYEKNLLKASFYTGNSTSLSSNVKYSAGYSNYSYGNQYQDAENFSIISVYRTNVDDRCNRLFVIDTGVLLYPNSVYNVQNPAIIVFNLPFDGCKNRKFTVNRRVEIPNYLWKNPAGLVYTALDYQPKGTCDDVFLYITNAFDYNIIVYDYKRGNFRAYSDPSMKPIQAESHMVFKDNFKYQYNFGIMNVALGYPDKYGYRLAYYAPAASIGEYAVSTKLLKNPKFFKNDKDGSTLLGYRKCDSQNMHQVLDFDTGVIFFAEMQSKTVHCWNIRNPINPDTIGVVFESDKLEFVAHIAVDSHGYLWFHSCHLPIIFGTDIPLNLTEVNARSFKVKVTDAIKGTVCDVYKYN